MCFGGGGGGGSVPTGRPQAQDIAPVYHPAKDDPPERFPTARPGNNASTPYSFSGRTGLAIPYDTSKGG